jgi:hypothetical protein
MSQDVCPFNGKFAKVLFESLPCAPLEALGAAHARKRAVGRVQPEFDAACNGPR